MINALFASLPVLSASLAAVGDIVFKIVFKIFMIVFTECNGTDKEQNLRHKLFLLQDFGPCDCSG